MKKLMMAAIGLMMATSMNAQEYLNDSGTPFEQDKVYVAASVSSAALSYTKSTDFNIGIGGKVGYFFIDNLMALGVVDFLSQSNGDYRTFEIGAGARYYFDKIGIYVGTLAKYASQKAFDTTVNDFQPEFHAGYAFFLGRFITIEPELYYKHSFKDSDYSGFGLRIGAGIYF